VSAINNTYETPTTHRGNAGTTNEARGIAAKKCTTPNMYARRRYATNPNGIANIHPKNPNIAARKLVSIASGTSGNASIFTGKATVEKIPL
jgi:hypothetical protein